MLPPPTAQQSLADAHVTPLTELFGPVLGEVTSDQPGPVGARVVPAAAGDALLLCGFAAMLNMARTRAAKQRVVAISARGLKRPDWEVGDIFMVID